MKKKLNSMKRETIRLEPDIQGLLKHRAEEKNITLSEYIRQLLMLGLEKEREIVTKCSNYSKLEKILLSNSIETLMIVHNLLDSSIISKIKENTRVLYKKIINDASLEDSKEKE